MRIPFRRRTADAESRPPPPAPADAIAAEALARARIEADGGDWDALGPRRRAAATREAGQWVLAARAAGFVLTPPPPPIPPGYMAVPADLAAIDAAIAVDPAQLVSCATCGCVISRVDRGRHARFHARTGAADQATAPTI